MEKKCFACGQPPMFGYTYCERCWEVRFFGPCRTDGCLVRSKLYFGRRTFCVACQVNRKRSRTRAAMRARRQGDFGDRSTSTTHICAVPGCQESLTGYRRYCDKHRSPKEKENRTNDAQTLQDS
jgi:hypothetical protein